MHSSLLNPSHNSKEEVYGKSEASVNLKKTKKPVVMP